MSSGWLSCYKTETDPLTGGGGLKFGDAQFPAVLTVNGKAELVVLAVGAFQEAIEAILKKRGISRSL